MDRKVDKLARTIWNYLRLGQGPEPADAILVLGSHDTRVAQRGTELLLEGWAPLLIFSGGRGAVTSKLWDRSEAEVFAKIALEMGIPEGKILLEKRSRNTGENIRFTKALVDSMALDLEKVLVVHKPYMERRVFAAMRKQWPEMEVVVTSPPISYQDYPDEVISREEFINTMVGDLQRVEIYSRKGFQIEQKIPDDVRSAFHDLVELGFDQRLVPGESRI